MPNTGTANRYRKKTSLVSQFTMTETATRALERYVEFEGMLGTVDANVIVSLLEFQRNSRQTGHLAEFGTYKGRSAALLAHYVQEGEELHLVDLADYLMIDKISQITNRFMFHKMDSAKFIEAGLNNKTRHKFRYIHSDGSHTFNNVYHDLKVADQLLASNGILSIDDYYNPHYPQVAAAIFTYLAKESSDLTMALVGANKCHLCRRSFAFDLATYIKSEFQDRMDGFGTPVQLSKTDRHDLFDCIGFKANPGRKLDNIYGSKLYGHLLDVT